MRTKKSSTPPRNLRESRERQPCSSVDISWSNLLLFLIHCVLVEMMDLYCWHNKKRVTEENENKKLEKAKSQVILTEYRRPSQRKYFIR